MTATQLPQKITRDDIKAKLSEIQDEATDTVESARTAIVAVAVAVGTAVIVGAYLFGRKRGRRKSTIVELKRA